MNLKQMEYFITIVNEGSISAASKILHISQPPLSTQMKLLEQELGVTLFERGSRAIALTHAGKVFYDRAQGILDMTGAARQELEHRYETTVKLHEGLQEGKHPWPPV